MPTLLQINTVANWGSTGRIAEGIAEVAMAMGWDCWTAFGRGEPKSKTHLIRVGKKWDMYRNAMAARLLDNEGLNARRATLHLIEKMKEIKPDVVHLHNIHGYYLNYPLLFSYLASTDIPVIWTLHDCWPFTGHCTCFDFVDCDKWKQGCNRCPQLKSYPASLGYDRSRRNYNWKRQMFNSLKNLTVVPVSDWLKGLVGQSFLAGNTIHRIYNGVDITQFRPIADESEELKTRIGIKTPCFALGVASNWNMHKGLDDFKKLRSHLPMEECSIVIVGLSEKQKAELPEGIIGLRRTNSIEELAQLYSAADVFVNPTWEDNFPTTNLESLACGTPVITYRTGGSPEAIDKRTGIVVKQGDIEKLASAVRTIMSQGKEHYQKPCRMRAVSLYDKSDRFAEYVRLYESIRH